MQMTVSFNGKSYVYVDGELVDTYDSIQNDDSVENGVIDKVTRHYGKKYIFDVLNSKMYLPDYKTDLIQGFIQSSHTYFEVGQLIDVKEYLPEEPSVIDIGANIGNHTLYWANECNAKKIYSFEPVPSTFKILKKNIEINNLQDRVELFNVGLYEKKADSIIKSYSKENIGGTHLALTDKKPKRKIPLIPLDSIEFNDENIDLIKIDVEGMDPEVLLGAGKTISRYKPLIMIESFPDEFERTNSILESYGYKKELTFSIAEYLYIYKN